MSGVFGIVAKDGKGAGREAEKQTELEKWF